MSRAFTKEDTEEPPFVVPRAPLPADTPNYVTLRGLAALRNERNALELARPENTEALAPLHAAHNARIAELDARIASAVLVDPASLPQDEVRFSAAVTLRSENGEIRRYRIVGVDEADVASGRITFVSPLARKLSGKRLGDAVSLRSGPSAGEEEYEITAIDYAPDP